MVDVKVGTFDVLNLARPGEQFYPDQRPYTLTEFSRPVPRARLRLDEAREVTTSSTGTTRTAATSWSARSDRNPQRIGKVANVRYFNDHLFDSRLSNDDRNRIISDRAQLVAEIRLRPG